MRLDRCFVVNGQIWVIGNASGIFKSKGGGELAFNITFWSLRPPAGRNNIPGLREKAARGINGLYSRVPSHYPVGDLAHTSETRDLGTNGYQDEIIQNFRWFLLLYLALRTSESRLRGISEFPSVMVRRGITDDWSIEF